MNFNKPTIDDIDQIRKALRDNEKAACEMAPANIILWSGYYQTDIAFFTDTIIFRSLREDGIYSFAGNFMDAEKGKVLFDAIVNYAHHLGQKARFHGITETEIRNIMCWYPNQYKIKCMRDAADYIYLREKLSTLSGKKLHGKRNHIRRFQDCNPDWCYEPIGDDNIELCEEMTIQWCRKNCLPENEQPDFDKIDESKIVVKALRNREKLGLKGGLIKTCGRAVAITLGEPVTNDTFVIHFEKAFNMQGAYPIINQQFVCHELSEYTYINREEDLGLSGLRKSKLSYRPALLLEKAVVKEI